MASGKLFQGLDIWQRQDVSEIQKLVVLAVLYYIKQNNANSGYLLFPFYRLIYVCFTFTRLLAYLNFSGDLWFVAMLYLQNQWNLLDFKIAVATACTEFFCKAGDCSR